MANAVDVALQQSSKALDTSNMGKDSIDALQAGMSLAQRQQQIEQQRQQIQFQQQQMEMQKHTWLHDQLSQALSENDVHLKKTLLDNISEQFPKIFEGRRIDPSMLELMKRSPTVADQMLSMGRLRNAVMRGKPDMISDVDREVLEGMTSSQVAQTLKSMSGITAQETKIIQSLSGKGIATPEAAAAAGTDQGNLQTQMNNAPGFAGQQTRAKVSQARLGLAEDDQATRAGDKFLKNPKLQNYVGIINKANSDLSLLNDPSRPVAPQTLSEVEATIPKLLDAAGSNALGAVERQEIMTGRRRLAGLLQNMSGDVQDMRKFNPQIVQFVQHTVERLKDLNETNASNLSVNIARGLETNSNPKVQDTVKAMLEQHFADKHPYYLNRFGASDASAPAGQASAPPAAGGANGTPGAPPAAPVRQQSGTAQAPMTTTMNPANPGSTTPKLNADQKSQWRQQALQKLQQIRSSPAGTMKTTEQDVRNTYKLLTGGEDLQE